MSNVLVATNEMNELRGGAESVAQNGVQDVQVTVGDGPGRRLLGSNEF